MKAIHVLLFLIMAALGRADTIELANGSKVEGKVLENNAAAKTLTIEFSLGGKLSKRTVPYASVKAITVNGARTEVNAPIGSATRTPAEVQALIAKVGSTEPDWFKSTPLNYPQTLDLSWAPPPQNNKWNNQVNVGQFIWDIINPNESRWREGIKFLYHVLEVNKDDPKISDRAMMEIANMYFRFFQDYERAAWWWQKAEVTEENSWASVFLAECYWRLGSKQMALDLMKDPDGYVDSIKLLGDMGEIDKSMAMAERYIRSHQEPLHAMLLAGDACRLAGRMEQAVGYYEKVVQFPLNPGNRSRYQRLINRAQNSIDAIKIFDQFDLSKVPDGSYTSSAQGYEAAVNVEVTVKSKRIESVKVTKHKEKQYYSSMRDVPAQIIAKQSVKGVEATSRATITGNAIINATAQAVAAAAK